MLTYQDCLELSELTEEEVEAIAEHEHIPEMLAVEMGRYMVVTPEGQRHIRRMILDDIRHARDTGNLHKAATLKLVLKHFCQTHPEAVV
jgi:hypothetical protein